MYVHAMNDLKQMNNMVSKQGGWRRGLVRGIPHAHYCAAPVGSNFQLSQSARHILASQRWQLEAFP